MKYLAIALICKPQIKLLYEFSKLVKAKGCNVVEARWFMLGGESMGHYLLSGNWNAIAKLETSLPLFEQKHEMTLIPRRVEIVPPHPDRLLYTIYLTAQDRPGIIEDVIGFLVDEEVGILDMNAYTYQGRVTQAEMASLQVSISISSKVLISDFRERFIGFCDDLNLDATLEPEKS